MTTTLNTQGRIQFSQPFNVFPWNYSGTESVPSIPTEVVDWVLLELRSELDASLILSRRAAFIKSNGMIVDTDGISQVKFPGMNSGNYYLVIRHRNHLPIMSANPVNLNTTNSLLYDFTTDQAQAYGNSPMKSLGDGNYAMRSGDAGADGDVDYPMDILVEWAPILGYDGYLPGDMNLNGTVDYIGDILDEWAPNLGFSSQVPEGSFAKPVKSGQNENMK